MQIGCHSIADAFSHQSVGCELAAKNGEKALKPIPGMIKDLEIAACTAALGIARGIEGACAGKGSENTLASQLWEKRFTNVEEAQDFLARGPRVVRPVGGHRGRTENGDGTVGHKNITV